MLDLGRTYPLKVTKRVAFGVYLDAQNLGEVLLPTRAMPKDCEIGSDVHAFIYLDSEDRPVATTRKPLAQTGEFAYLKVVDTNAVGAFLDWGLEKDLLVPFAEQHRKMEVGRSYLVYVYVDPRDDRIVASSKIDKFVAEANPRSFQVGQAVDLLIANSTELGFKAIINHSHWGVLYKHDVFERLSFGQRVPGFIRQIRPDGKIDLTLNGGSRSHDKNTKTVLQYLKKHNGYAPLHDKSEPEEISAALGMSKGAFKKAIGNLYKKQEILLEPGGIRLAKTAP
ncbi:MAG TPA: S1-like domain-containing RNA-binding protein [Marinagarivorans sp.]